MAVSKTNGICVSKNTAIDLAVTAPKATAAAPVHDGLIAGTKYYTLH